MRDKPLLVSEPSLRPLSPFAMMVQEHLDDGRRGVDKALVRPLFDWGYCQQCAMVSEGWDPWASPVSPCPSCGFAGAGTEWPPPPAGLLLKQAFRRDAVDQEEFAFQAFLIAEMIDIFFGWVLKTAIETRAAEDPRMARLADGTEGYGQPLDKRLDLLKKVGDIRLHEAAAVLEEPSFPERWRDLSKRRDLFVGRDGPQETLAFEGLTEDDLLEISRMAVKIFAHINNAVW